MSEQFESDGEALDELNRVGIEHCGGIILFPRRLIAESKALSAADYLCDEWDYHFEWIGEDEL